jgi:hypothetical protein
MNIREVSMKPLLPMLAVLCLAPSAAQDQGKKNDLVKAVLLYASFDEAVRANFGGGSLTLSTRTNDPKDKTKFIFKKGFNSNVFRIAPNKGIQGGALEVVDVLPSNGRIFFPAKDNIAFKKGGWSGAVSFWINTDPNKLLKTPFCDPVQITQKGANNGGIWFDFNNAKPRDCRMGVFSAVPASQKPISEDDAKAPMVRVPAVKFKAGEWHHIVLTWKNLDTGKPNGQAMLYIDGKKQGSLDNASLAMDWDIDKAGIYVAVNFIGLLDEFAVFRRMLTPEEVTRLHQSPDLLAGLKSH